MTTKGNFGPRLPLDKRGSRRYPTHTKLGQVMLRLNLRAYDVASGSTIPPRKLSDYLAGREKIRPAHLVRLSEYLQVPPEQLLEDMGSNGAGGH